MANHGSTKKLIDPPLRYLTKSLVRTALTCPRKLVYATNPKSYPRNDSIVKDPFVKHLADEGKRFGDYCRRLFPHGVEIGPPARTNADQNSIIASVHAIPDAEELVARTNQIIQQDDNSESQQRVTIFEGAVRSGPFFVRPDILDKIVHPNPASRTGSQTELRVIEVKSKSYDSRPSSKRGQMWNVNKKSVKANFLPYIQDIAFQSFVVRRAFPDYDVSSWLMLPDCGKIWNGVNNNPSLFTEVPTLDDTLNAINESTAFLLNVDELVEVALSKTVEQWAEQLSCEDLEASFSEIPIGSQCASCTYRIKSLPDTGQSDANRPRDITAAGFDVCWEKATGLGRDELQQPLVVDLYGYSRETIKKSIEQGKFFLKDLSADDFKSKKESEPNDKISSTRRQWYQVSSLRNESMNSFHEPQYVLKRDSLRQEMDRPNIRGLSRFGVSSYRDRVLSSLLASNVYTSSLSLHEKETLSALLSDGSRPMVDLCKLAADYYYVDGSGGSSSIKRLLAPTMNVSARLKDIYGHPAYNSNNFVNFQWYQQDDKGLAIDPYKILSGINPVNDGVSDEETSSVTHGGGAATAFHELQCNIDLSEQDRRIREQSLLRYCELDTLSMAMIVQAWQSFLEQ
ncbi:hypothetical protein HJC23_004394 [Cyclotella cryptica]|uniref:YqaJ viral recombinase domain-containing protein n=1 Tax=Cyclotella cryptica TaxID=29204 RepID=A0ABD3NSP2_9STRA